MIIADENIEQYWINLLRSTGYPILSVRETKPGISDAEVITLVKHQQGLLLTEDKDFGELIFAHRIRGISVIFLRYDAPNYWEIETSLLHVVAEYYPVANTHLFITITAGAIQVRNI